MKKKKYHIITIGCQMNKSDSERFASRLVDLGYQKTDRRNIADLVVITTCGVRQSAEDRVYGLVPRIKKDNPKTKIIVTGCLVYRNDIKKRLKEYVDLWLPIDKMLVYELIVGNKNFGKEIGNECGDYLSISPNYGSKISAFVPIGNGCDNYCSYCVVPFARGREKYRPVQEIISEVEDLIKKGYKEITLIAQNVNSYKSTGPGNVNFSKLLKMVNDIPGNFWVRFATSHPKDMSDELIRIISECGKVCRHIHLPVQAGDDKVLSLMNRKYTISHYKELIKKIRKVMPDSSLTTDIIVGFPGETKAQFDNTKKLFKEINFDMAYIAQYSPRPGTAAEKLLDDVPKAEKKNREEELTKILRRTALRNNRKYLKKTIEVLVDVIGKKGELLGKTRTSKVVRIKSGGVRAKYIRVGDFVFVKIQNAQDFGLSGVLSRKL